MRGRDTVPKCLSIEIFVAKFLNVWVQEYFSGPDDDHWNIHFEYILKLDQNTYDMEDTIK